MISFDSVREGSCPETPGGPGWRIGAASAGACSSMMAIGPKPPKAPPKAPRAGPDPLPFFSFIGSILPRSTYSRGVSEVADLGDHLTPDRLEPLESGGVAQADDDVLGADVGELAEPVHEHARGVVARLQG